jgi:hypothetical protein
LEFFILAMKPFSVEPDDDDDDIVVGWMTY